MGSVGRLTGGLAVVLAGCVHVGTAWVEPDGGGRVPTCPAAVMIYTAEGGVGRPYHTIALLSASGETAWTSEEEMVLSLRDRAAELGATGLILGGIYEPDAPLTIAGELLGSSARREGRAAAIYVDEDSARVSTRCRPDVTPP